MKALKDYIEEDESLSKKVTYNEFMKHDIKKSSDSNLMQAFENYKELMKEEVMQNV